MKDGARWWVVWENVAARCVRHIHVDEANLPVPFKQQRLKRIFKLIQGDVDAHQLAAGRGDVVRRRKIEIAVVPLDRKSVV